MGLTKATAFLLVAHLIGCARAQDVSQECPETNGYYADSVQCDRYYECKDGQIFDKLCPDGLVFDENSNQIAKCSFHFSVDCHDRPELQPAQRSGVCPRLNGYFGHEDPKVCDKFYFCVDGVANPISCPATLIFDPTKGQCAYSDQVKRKGCSGEEVYKFQCPQNVESLHEHPRFPDPDDCQFYYICINGVSPRRNGCTHGLVFNTKSLSCERQDKVKGHCRTWYNATFLEGLEARRLPSKPISSLKTRKRVKVIRKNPNASALRTNPVQGPEEGDRPLRARVRQRRPGSPQRAPALIEQSQDSGPPTFALNDEDSIQQFRRNHAVGDSRLTILQTPNNPLSPVQGSVPLQEEKEEEEEERQPPRRQRPVLRRRPSGQRRPARPSPPRDENREGRPEFNSFAPRF